MKTALHPHSPAIFDYVIFDARAKRNLETRLEQGKKTYFRFRANSFLARAAKVS
jgi:hypothetical protein